MLYGKCHLQALCYTITVGEITCRMHHLFHIRAIASVVSFFGSRNLIIKRQQSHSVRNAKAHTATCCMMGGELLQSSSIMRKYKHCNLLLESVITMLLLLSGCFLGFSHRLHLSNCILLHPMSLSALSSFTTILFESPSCLAILFFLSGYIK